VAVTEIETIRRAYDDARAVTHRLSLLGWTVMARRTHPKPRSREHYIALLPHEEGCRFHRDAKRRHRTPVEVLNDLRRKSRGGGLVHYGDREGCGCDQRRERWPGTDLIVAE
jgi:hypothetical protein